MGQKQNGGESEGESRGVAEKGQSRMEFVGDPSVIQYLTLFNGRSRRLEKEHNGYESRNKRLEVGNNQ